MHENMRGVISNWVNVNLYLASGEKTCKSESYYMSLRAIARNSAFCKMKTKRSETERGVERAFVQENLPDSYLGGRPRQGLFAGTCLVILDLFSLTP